MAKNQRLKVYTKEHGLIKSKPIKNRNEIFYLLSELSTACTIKTAFLTDGTKSERLIFSLEKQKLRPIFYTRSDGEQTFLLPINPKHYPVTAHYSNGTIEKINLIS